MSLRRLTAFICLLFFMAGPAAAQFSFGGDSDILIDAEKATYQGRTTRLEGNVDVRQGEAQIFSDIMFIYRAERPKDGSTTTPFGAVTRIEAEGNFRYITPESTVTGDKGVYERQTGVITVTGKVKVVQKSGSTATTDKLTYNVKTETIRFQGDCLGKQCTGRPSVRIK